MACFWAAVALIYHFGLGLVSSRVGCSANAPYLHLSTRELAFKDQMLENVASVDIFFLSTATQGLLTFPVSVSVCYMSAQLF